MDVAVCETAAATPVGAAAGAAADDSVGEQVARVLVEFGHCSPDTLASLFQTCRGLARLVFENAAQVHLAFAADSLNVQRHMASAAELLHAAGVLNEQKTVIVTLRGEPMQVPDSLWECMTDLVLHGMRLAAGDARTLVGDGRQQRRLRRLRLAGCSLVLAASHGHTEWEGCNGVGTAASYEKAGGGVSHGARAAGSSEHCGRACSACMEVETLECADCTPPQACNGRALALINCEHLDSLHVEGLATDLLPLLPSLTHLTLSLAWIDDRALSHILTHPTLRSVSATGLQLRTDHSSAAVKSLRELHIHGVCDPMQLGMLPLASPVLGLVAFEGFAWLEGHHATQDSQLAAVLPWAHKLRCVPTAHAGHWDAGVGGSFWLSLPHTATLQQMQQVIASCIGPQLHGALTLSWPHTELIDALSTSLPAHVTTLAFYGKLATANPHEGTFINNLPAHVTHVVLSHWRVSADVLKSVLSGIARPVHVTLHEVHCAWDKNTHTGWEDCYPGLASQAHAWVQQHSPAVRLTVVG